jgi:hypothetical protein
MGIHAIPTSKATYMEAKGLAATTSFFTRVGAAQGAHERLRARGLWLRNTQAKGGAITLGAHKDTATVDVPNTIICLVGIVAS